MRIEHIITKCASVGRPCPGLLIDMEIETISYLEVSQWLTLNQQRKEF